MEFIKIKTFNNKYHVVRPIDILRILGSEERDGELKSKVYLKDNDTTLNCCQTELEIMELLNNTNRPN